MTGLLLSLALLGTVIAQTDSPPNPPIGTDSHPVADQTSPAPTAGRPAGSSSVRTISATNYVRPGTPTRTVCGWEGTTGSTMKRRVCRQVADNSQTELDNREMLRNLQGARVEPIN